MTQMTSCEQLRLLGAQTRLTFLALAVASALTFIGLSAPTHALDDDTALAAPVQLAPADRSAVQESSITTTWAEVEGATHYLYESWDDAAATIPRWSGDVTATSATIADVPEGTYWWRVKAVNGSGTESDWSPLWRVAIDNTPPLFDLAPDSLIARGSIDVIITDVNLATITLDDEPATVSGDGPTYTLTVSGQGTHRIVATDKAGNTATLEFTLDSVAPDVRITAATRNADGSYTITGTTTDSAAITLSINDNDFIITPASGLWSFVTTPLTDGAYLIEAASTDQAGNTGIAEPYSFTVSTVALPAPVGDGSTEEPTSSAAKPKEETVAKTSPLLAQLFIPGSGTMLSAQDSADADSSSTPLEEPDDTAPNATNAQTTDSDNKQSPSLLGLAWYWWLGIVVALIAAGSVIVSRLRGDGDA